MKGLKFGWEFKENENLPVFSLLLHRNFSEEFLFG
jgi:hypothetical protein